MSKNPAADYAAAVAALAAAKEQVEAEFAAAKVARQADPGDAEAKARYIVARDALQAVRAADRGAVTTVGGDAVAQEG